MNRLALAAVVAGLVLLVAGAVVTAGDAMMSIPEALLLGVVEGVTEFLPISSTGHLTVTAQLLGLASSDALKAATDAYTIVIQAGAILAVLGLYRLRIANAVASIFGRGRDVDAGRRLLAALIGGFVPAAVLGLAFDDWIKEHLFGIWPVVAAWIVGGIAILAFSHTEGHRPLETLGLRQGLVIGVAQALALWPGTSRSLVTILAALALGYSLSAAVEFSFLLGLVTLGGATVYEALGSSGLIIDTFGITAPLVGFLAAFASAAVAVKWMVNYLHANSLDVFGWYRIAIGILVGALALAGLV